MKKLFLALFTISAALILTSCGSDDPEKVEKVFKGTATQNTILKGFKGSQITISSEESELETLLSGSEGYGSPISSSVFSIKESTVKIVGLKDGVKLENLSLNINGKASKNLGTITNTTADLYNDANLQYFQEVLGTIAKDGIIKAQITYTPTEDIMPEDKVKLEISLKGTFTYWKIVD